MIGLSAKAIYAINIVYTLGFTPTKSTMQVKELAAMTHISHPYVEQILSRLRNAQLVVSIRGAKGGYALAKSASEISVLEIVRAVEEPTVDYGCAQVINALFEQVQENIHTALDVPLSELHQRFLPLMYEI